MSILLGDGHFCLKMAPKWLGCDRDCTGKSACLRRDPGKGYLGPQAGCPWQTILHPVRPALAHLGGLTSLQMMHPVQPPWACCHLLTGDPVVGTDLE